MRKRAWQPFNSRGVPCKYKLLGPKWQGKAQRFLLNGHPQCRRQPGSITAPTSAPRDLIATYSYCCQPGSGRAVCVQKSRKRAHDGIKVIRQVKEGFVDGNPSVNLRRALLQLQFRQQPHIQNPTTPADHCRRFSPVRIRALIRFPRGIHQGPRRARRNSSPQVPVNNRARPPGAA